MARVKTLTRALIVGLFRLVQAYCIPSWKPVQMNSKHPTRPSEAVVRLYFWIGLVFQRGGESSPYVRDNYLGPFPVRNDMSKEALIEIASLERPVNDISGTQPDRPDRSKLARPTPGSPGGP